jgi:hypothetical protein
VPESAHGTAVRFAPAFHAGEKRSIERIALGAIAAFARAHALALVAGGFFHGGPQRKTSDPNRQSGVAPHNVNGILLDGQAEGSRLSFNKEA